jgi:hypothetical protein
MIMRTGTFSLALLLSLSVAGCVRRDERNADRKWPQGSPTPLGRPTTSER